ncbi:IS110 family transposase [Aerococcaceae bacterium zg-BR9]|uniref:IS110 family transposase n=1 Tax=Aerococcaceae bacterium zg-1292 TaxID=2774330 RepID=UPI004064B79C|nr:IS110 family transposase [Aerococcaceae bacterium zg-BR9]
MKLIVGLDVSSRDLKSCFLTDDAHLTVHKQMTVENNQLGANLIKEVIFQLVNQLEIHQVIIGMEATSLYSSLVAEFFYRDLELNKLNLMVSVEQPNKIKLYRQAFSESKDDFIDAFYIADYFRNGRFQPSSLKEDKYRALQDLTRARYQMVTQLTESKQHFIEFLYYKCNSLKLELEENGQSNAILSSSIIQLMSEEYSLDDLATTPLEDLAALLQKLGHGRFKHPENLALAIQKAIRNSYRLSDMRQHSVDQILAVYAKQIKAFEQSIKSLNKSIEGIVETMSEYQSLVSIPGIGPVYAARIIAEIGQIDRFDLLY